MLCGTTAPISPSTSKDNLAQANSYLTTNPYKQSSQRSNGNDATFESSSKNISSEKLSSKDLKVTIPNPDQRPNSFGQDSRSPVIPLPEVPASFPELEKLSDIQLERFLSDPIAIEAHLNSIASVESMRSLRDQVRQSNFDLASKTVLKVSSIYSS